MIDGTISGLDKEGRVGTLTSDDGHEQVRFASDEGRGFLELSVGQRVSITPDGFTPDGLGHGWLSYLVRGGLVSHSVRFEKEYG